MAVDVNQVQHGWDVFSSDERKIGGVTYVGANYVLVTKGFLFTKDIYIPTSAITGIEQDRVYVDVSKDQVEDMGWDQPPTDTADVFQDAMADAPVHEKDVEEELEHRAVHDSERASDAVPVDIDEIGDVEPRD